MTIRNIPAVLNLVMVILTCFTGSVLAMEQIPKINMLFDAPRAPLYPRIGFYVGQNYDFAEPLVAISSRHIVQVMPEIVLRNLGNIYKLAGSLAEIRAGLNKQINNQNLHVSLLVWAGLTPRKDHYNVVLHQILGDWLNKGETEAFQITIPAGLFVPDGVRGGTNDLPFSALGDLVINKHDSNHYSPDNGRFYPVPGRDIISFWLIARHDDHVVVSYNLMFLAPEAVKTVIDFAYGEYELQNAKTRFKDMLPDTFEDLVNRLALLAALMQDLALTNKEDRAALEGMIHAITSLVRATTAEEKKTQSQAPAKKSAEEKKAQAQPKVPAKKPAGSQGEIKRQQGGASTELTQLKEQLIALDAALAKKLTQEERDQALAREMAAKFKADEERLAQDEAFALSLQEH